MPIDHMVNRGLEPAGASPLHPTPFSLLRQRKGGKRKATPDAFAPGCARGSLWCSKARPGAERTPFAALTAFERPRRVCLRGALKRAGLSFCAPRLGIGGPPNSQQPNSPDFNQPLRRFAGSPMRCREAQEIGAACASTPPHPDRRGRSNAVSAANGVRSAPGSVLRALRLDTNSPEGWLCLPKDSASGAGTQGTPCRSQGAAHRGRLSLSPFLFGEAKRNGVGVWG